ncbi:MAG: alpha/beta hydrolase-fold protein [Terracidiphilus sp.]|jgi:esterase/lipase superfamily enzyme
MNREYHEWQSKRLNRSMELLVFGHAGLPVLVFPTSSGRFFDFEDRGMVAALAAKIDAGQMQLFCVDSVDQESWYNRQEAPSRRVARHMQYEAYLLDEVVPHIHQKNPDPRLLALGCSFGGYHAVNIALRHPELFSGFFSMSGVFDLTGFLQGHYDQDCYFHLPTHYLPRLEDPQSLDHMRASTYVLTTGLDDQCLVQNQQLDRILTERGIPHRFYVSDAPNSHDWPTWQRMVQDNL